MVIIINKNIRKLNNIKEKNMKKLLVLLVFVLCLLASKGYSQDYWKYVGENSAVVIYYDNQTIKYEKYGINNSVTVYLKYVYKSDYSIEYGIDFSMYKYIIYCDEYKYRKVSITNYYNDGRIQTPDSYDYGDIEPGTAIKAVYILLCK